MISMQSVVRMLLVTLSVIVLLGGLMACTLFTQTFGLETPPKHDPAFVVCKSFKRLYYEDTDAEKTKTAIDDFDARYDALCPPPPAPIRQQATAGEAEFKSPPQLP